MRILLAALEKGEAREAEFFEWGFLVYDHSCLFNSVFQRQPLICWMKNSRVIKSVGLIGLMRWWTYRDEMTSRIILEVNA